MRHHVFMVLFALSCFSAMAQKRFDSIAVSSKVKTHMEMIRQSWPIMSSLTEVSRRVEQRVDFASPSFDFKRAGDPIYLSQKTRKVLVMRFPDIKLSGCDVYVQNGVTMYPLTNLELHADETGKIVRDLPMQEIQHARNLLDTSGILSLDQIKSVVQNTDKPSFRISHARLILDLRSSAAVWQLLGDPDWRANRQESIEIDAVSGRIIRHKSNATNLSSATGNR